MIKTTVPPNLLNFVTESVTTFAANELFVLEIQSIDPGLFPAGTFSPELGIGVPQLSFILSIV